MFIDENSELKVNVSFLLQYNFINYEVFISLLLSLRNHPVLVLDLLNLFQFYR